MKNLTKRELIDQSIDNMFSLLSEIGCHPSNFVAYENVVRALSSQGGLCALNIDFQIESNQYSIQPMSLNTLKKRLLNNGPDRDFEYLDRLRVHALMAITRHNAPPIIAPKKRTKSFLESRMSESESSLSRLHAVNMVLIQVLEVNRRDLLTISQTTNTEIRQKRINDAINRIIKILSLNPAPYDDLTLISKQTHLQLVSNEKKDH